jgi:hypothetical protein
MEIWKQKQNFAERKRKQIFFYGNGIAFSGGTDAKTEFLFPVDMEFLFYG